MASCPHEFCGSDMTDPATPPNALPADQPGWLPATLQTWEAAETASAAQEVSFLRQHGSSLLTSLLHRLIWSSNPVAESDLEQLSSCCRKWRPQLAEAQLPARYSEALTLLTQGRLEKLQSILRPRLLVAGHDLKFLGELMPLFESRFDVRVDQWSGHDIHQEHDSETLLEWADMVWVEWMLGASVWYSKRVQHHQQLIIRAHRSEMTVNYGLQLQLDQVDAIIAIAPRILGDFADRFDIPRSKFVLVPNALAVGEYAIGSSSERLNHIAMIGAVPKLKGLERAIRLLAELRRDLPNLQLHVYGKRPEEYEWLMRRPAEKAYFQRTDALIDELGLRDAVHFDGWVDTKATVAKVAAVISMSDLEGMQVAVAEGFLGGGVGMTLHWRGADQGYPASSVFDSVDDMRVALLEVLRDPAALERRSAEGRSLITRLYGVDRVWQRLQRLFHDITERDLNR